MAKYYIIPNGKDIIAEIDAPDAEGAMNDFAISMDTDINAYFKAVTEQEYDEWRRKQDSEAHERHVTAFMTSVAANDFGYNEEDAACIGVKAYLIYCEGNGQTEYECVEQAVEEYEEEYGSGKEGEKE